MSYSYTYLEDAQYRAIVRALSDIPNGVVVDLGPQHPGPQSLTSVLYEREWQGISLEPVPQYLNYLNTVRPKDINLRAVAGAVDTWMQYTDLGPAGWQLSPGQGAAPTAEQDSVLQMTLQGLLAKHQLGTLHLLRVGLQAGEWPWHLGLDWQGLRPWLVVIEPEGMGGWDLQMPLHGYILVEGSGTRQIWLAQEHQHLLQALQTPHPERLPLPPMVPKAIVQEQIKAQEEARVQQANARPFWVKIKVALQEGRFLWTIKAHLRRELSTFIRWILTFPLGRRVSYFLTRTQPKLQYRLRFMSPKPKPVHSTEVAELLERFAPRMPAPSSSTELKA